MGHGPHSVLSSSSPEVNVDKDQGAAKLLSGDASSVEHRGGLPLEQASRRHGDSVPEILGILGGLVKTRCPAGQTGRCRAIAICGLNVNEHLSPGAETFQEHTHQSISRSLSAQNASLTSFLYLFSFHILGVKERGAVIAQ